MDNLVRTPTDVDVPTPTKDEPVVQKTCTPKPSGDSNCGILTSDPQDTSRDSVTPTLDENPIDPDCPTPTIDEPVEKFTNRHSDNGLTVEEVKCKLFDKDTMEKVRVSDSHVKDSKSSSESDNKDNKKPSVKAGDENGSETDTVVEKMVPNGNPSKTLSNETTSDHEGQKKIAVTCDGELFTCNECDYTNKGHHFEEHLMCHLIHKPYQCLYCKDAFASRREIGKHLSTMHKGKKLNCMLKALNRAKTLMLDAKKTNSCVFFALVPGSELKLKRKLSTESTGSVSSLSRSTSDSDGSQKSSISLPPSRQTSQLSDSDTKETPMLPSSGEFDKAKEVTNDSEQVKPTTEGNEIAVTSPCKDISEDTKAVNIEVPDEVSNCRKSVDNVSSVNGEPSLFPKDSKDSPNNDKTKDINETDQDLCSSKEVSKEEMMETEKCEEKDGETCSDKKETLSSENDVPATQNVEEGVSETEKTENMTRDVILDEPVTKESECVSATDVVCENSDVMPQSLATNCKDSSSTPAMSDAEDDQIGEQISEEKERESALSHPKEILTCSQEHSETEVTHSSNNKSGSSDHSEEMGNHEKEVTETVDEISPSQIEANANIQSTPGEDGDSVTTDNPSADKENSGDKVDESDSMGIKIVASFSLDGDDYSKCEEEKVDSNEVSEQNTASDADKTENDTSGVVIDVFKDGRIAVHDTKASGSTPDKTDTSPKKSLADNSVDAEPEIQPKVHQTRLGQLLTGSSSFPEAFSSSPSSSIPDKMNSTNSTQANNSSASVMAASAVPVSSQSTSSTVLPTQSQPVVAPGITPAQMKHMRNPNFYVCGLNCNFSCLNSVEFRDHLFLGHAGEKAFPCYYCGWLAHTEESLLRHITNHAHTYSKTAPLYLCGMHRCRFGTNLLSDLLNHMQILHHDITEYVCKECNDTFSDIKDLVSHFEENFIHVVNCPHCACKGTDRRMILKHIAEYHPGKAKMVSVAKQIICKDRKVNNYKQIRAQYKSGASVVSISKSVAETSTSSEKKLLSGSLATYTSLKESQNKDQAVSVKEEDTSRETEYGSIPSTATGSGSNDASPSEKQIKAPKCGHCTFVARDQRRLESHMKCHGLPVIKRHRFRCLYCPQGFDSSQKFRLHINCHPGLIKYWMYYCKRCDFDSNQRYVMLRHIRTRDELHFNVGNEEDMFTVVERIMESRVLECEHCNYQTRHKLHLQIHYQREHKVIKAAAHSSSDSGKHKMNQQVPWTSPTHSSSTTDSCQENMSKKFKCPFCRYLVPKAADLKSHVKKHANLGKITIDFLRCRYCSLSSTARNIVYSHIREKHAGKPLVLVRKIVTIDCSGNDNSFSETSVTEAPLTVSSSSSHSIDKFQCETCSFATTDRREFDSHVQLHNTTKGGIHGMSMEDDSDDDEDDNEEAETGVDHPQPDDDLDDTKPEVAPPPQPSPVDMIEQVYVIPETVAGDQLSSPARCCNCYYASGYRSAFIDHMTSNHPSVMLVVRNKGTTVEQICPNGRMFFGLPITLNNEVLLVPDRQVFTQAVKCPKCPNFTTYFRRNLVLHLSKDHAEITAMGKCTWPGWQASSGGSSSSQAQAGSTSWSPKIKSPKRPATPPEKQDESCIIGSGDLDEQIACLYKNFGDRQQCLICNSSKPKKFFMHIHILRHLNIYLVRCPYCPHKGLQKYKIGRHIRTNHPERENVVKEIKNDISKKVADFLTHQKKVVAAASASPVPKHSSMASFNKSEDSNLSPKSERDVPSINRMSGPLGTPYLDEKLLCLYTSASGKNKCNLCSVEFARKYAIHRHIVVNHLKVSLLKCGHCNFQGVEKHVIIDHILEQHKNQQIMFEPLDINMEEKVQEFLNTYNVVKSEPGVTEQDSSYAVSPQKVSGPQAYCLGKDKLHNTLVPLFTRKGESYKCNLCKWKFPRKYAIHRHILMKHLKIGLYGCTHCHVQGAEKYIVVSHMKEAHPKVPPQARILEVDMSQRIQEVLQEAAVGTGNHTSGRMPRSYSYDAELPDAAALTVDSKMNIQVEDTDQKPMVVAMFGKKRKPSPEIPVNEDTVVTPKKLKTTSRMVDVSTKIKVVCVQDGNFKKYVCEKCRFTSLHRSNVYRHVLRIHERYRELQCDYCGYKTYSKVLLDQHMEVEHDGIYPEVKKEMTATVKQEPSEEEDSNLNVSAGSTSSQPVKHYACAYCNFETSTAENIIKHTRENHAPGGGESHNKSGPETPKSTSDPDITVSCHEHVVKKSSVKRGTFTESQMLYCGFCTFKAPGVQAVKDHHKENHQPNKLCIISPQPWRYICRVCGLKNNAGSKMRCHLNRHLEYRPYTCSSCNQSYASTDELRKHVRNLRHSDNFQYLKHEKKEQKINRYLEESRKNALLVNIGAPPGEESMGLPSATVSRTDEILNLKEPSPSPEPRFKGIKRAMKMPMSPTKSLKKKYWKSGLDRESKAVTKDIACHWCDIPHTVSVDQMKQHHAKEHPNKDFLWVDTRQGNTCGVTGEIVISGNLIETPKISDLYTSKQLANNKMKFYCTRCSFSAWYLPAMVSHCRCHQPKKYLCGYCHLRYSNRDYLEKHQGTFHPHRDPWLLYMVEGESSEHGTTASTFSPATSELKTENTSDDDMDGALAAPVEERRISQQIMYCCNFCSYQNESLYQYRLHLPVHGTFRHLKTDLSNDSPLKCGFCPYVAQDQTDFSLHITTHFENRSYKCAHCNYSAYTRAHVKYHSANQHPDLEQVVLDLSSAASYVEYLKADTTNLPKLVHLDPRVVLVDIKAMSQSDLEALMTEELNKELNRSYDKDEDEFVDVEGLDEVPVMKDLAADRVQSNEAAEIQKTGRGDSKPMASDLSTSDQAVDSSMEVEMASGDVSLEDHGNSGQSNVSGRDMASSTPDKGDLSGVVSSSVGTDEDGAGFDIAEVSAFAEDSDTSKQNKSDIDHNLSGSVGDKSINISGVKSIDSSADSLMDGNINGDEVDGDSVELQDKAPSSSKSTPQSKARDKSPDSEDKVKKDDSGNVFDTLHSWLGMK